MRSRTLTFGIVASALGLAAPLPFSGTAHAGTLLASCTETGTVSLGVPNLLSGTPLGGPVVASLVPGDTTSGLANGPSCTPSVSSFSQAVARLKVNSATGLVSGTMTATTSGPFTPGITITLTCGPALTTCEGSAPLPYALFSTYSPTCSVSGVVAVTTSVSCSIETP